MDEEARRHYGVINAELDYLYPNDARTPDQIGFVSVNYWRVGREALEQQRDGAQNYAEATIIELGAQADAVAEIDQHYSQQIEVFEQQLDTAVREIYRENGIAFEENAMNDRTDPREAERVKLYNNEQREADKHRDEQINRDGGQEVNRADLLNDVRDLPRERDPAPSLPDRAETPQHLTPEYKPPTPSLPGPNTPLLHNYRPPQREQANSHEAKDVPEPTRGRTQPETAERSDRDIPGRVPPPDRQPPKRNSSQDRDDRER